MSRRSGDVKTVLRHLLKSRQSRFGRAMCSARTQVLLSERLVGRVKGRRYRKQVSYPRIQHLYCHSHYCKEMLALLSDQLGKMAHYIEMEPSENKVSLEVLQRKVLHIPYLGRIPVLYAQVYSLLNDFLI